MPIIIGPMNGTRKELPAGALARLGAMNLMAVWTNSDGERELITASLEDGTVLPGVTRESVLELARDETGLKVTERDWTIDELIDAIQEGRT